MEELVKVFEETICLLEEESGTTREYLNESLIHQTVRGKATTLSSIIPSLSNNCFDKEIIQLDVLSNNCDSCVWKEEEQRHCTHDFLRFPSSLYTLFVNSHKIIIQGQELDYRNTRALLIEDIPSSLFYPQLFTFIDKSPYKLQLEHVQFIFLRKKYCVLILFETEAEAGRFFKNLYYRNYHFERTFGDHYRSFWVKSPVLDKKEMNDSLDSDLWVDLKLSRLNKAPFHRLFVDLYGNDFFAVIIRMPLQITDDQLRDYLLRKKIDCSLKESFETSSERLILFGFDQIKKAIIASIVLNNKIMHGCLIRAFLHKKSRFYITQRNEHDCDRKYSLRSLVELYCDDIDSDPDRGSDDLEKGEVRGSPRKEYLREYSSEWKGQKLQKRGYRVSDSHSRSSYDRRNYRYDRYRSRYR